MDQKTREFNTHRPCLFSIAYRMLSSRADAEDILQDAYLRWHDMETAGLRSTEAWLVTVVTRLCIDRLRNVKAEREAYAGPWLPEPLISSAEASPEAAAELASDVSIAFLMVLERLAPEERAAFLLHQVFDTDYPEVAAMLGKSEAACRQLVHRARMRVRREQPRFTVSRDAHLRLLEKFTVAARSGDRAQLTALFAEDATLTGDGGGKAVSVLKVLHGADRIARLFHVIARRFGERAHLRHVDINGEPGLLRFIDGRLDATISCVTDGEHIVALYTVRNPDKLKGISLD